MFHQSIEFWIFGVISCVLFLYYVRYFGFRIRNYLLDQIFIDCYLTMNFKLAGNIYHLLNVYFLYKINKNLVNIRGLICQSEIRVLPVY